MTFFYRTIIILLKLIAYAVFRLQISGRAYIPEHGPYIVVANHLSVVDIPIVMISIPHRVYYLAKEQLFHYPVISWLLKLFEPIPINRKKADIGAIRGCLDILKQGKVLTIFPEGSRSRNIRLNNCLPGAAFIAAQSNCLLLPIGISGTEGNGNPLMWFRRPRVRVNIGASFSLNSKRGEKIDYTQQASIIKDKLSELLPAKYGGEIS